MATHCDERYRIDVVHDDSEMWTTAGPIVEAAANRTFAHPLPASFVAQQQNQ